MDFPRRVRLVVAAAALLLVTTACQGEEAELTTTSSLVSSPTATSEASTTSVAPVEESTSTTLAGQPVTEYEIVTRVSDPEGETVYIVVPPGAYTDIDVESFVIDLVESGVATYGAEIFDNPAAVDAFLKPEAERTEEEQALVDASHFASLVEANRIIYRGPFASLGEATIGS